MGGIRSKKLSFFLNKTLTQNGNPHAIINSCPMLANFSVSFETAICSFVCGLARCQTIIPQTVFGSMGSWWLLSHIEYGGLWVARPRCWDEAMTNTLKESTFGRPTRESHVDAAGRQTSAYTWVFPARAVLRFHCVLVICATHNSAAKSVTANCDH